MTKFTTGIALTVGFFFQASTVFACEVKEPPKSDKSYIEKTDELIAFHKCFVERAKKEESKKDKKFLDMINKWKKFIAAEGNKFIEEKKSAKEDKQHHMQNIQGINQASDAAAKEDQYRKRIKLWRTVHKDLIAFSSEEHGEKKGKTEHTEGHNKN